MIFSASPILWDTRPSRPARAGRGVLCRHLIISICYSLFIQQHSAGLTGASSQFVFTVKTKPTYIDRMLLFMF